jgi:ATP-dependent protease HslVU (ClpYQ) peptidase subunit
MTIICAMHEPGVGTWIGSDRLRGGSRKVIMAKPKFILVGGWAIGVAGYARAADAVEMACERIAACKSVQDVAVALRQVLKADGFERATDSQVENYGSDFIVAAVDGVWDIDAGFAISPIPNRTLHANGSGQDEARGAAYAARALDVTDAGLIVRVAVEAAISNCQGCGGEPFVHLLAE